MAAGYAGARSHDIGYLFFQLLTGLGALVAGWLRAAWPVPVSVPVRPPAVGHVRGHPRDRHRCRRRRGFANLVPVADIAIGRAVRSEIRTTTASSSPTRSCWRVGWFAITRSIRLRVGLARGRLDHGHRHIAVPVARSGRHPACRPGGVCVRQEPSAWGWRPWRPPWRLVIVGYPLFVESRLVTEIGSCRRQRPPRASTRATRVGSVPSWPGPSSSPRLRSSASDSASTSITSALVTEQGGGLVAHNWYGTVLAEQGLLGVVLWLAHAGRRSARGSGHARHAHDRSVSPCSAQRSSAASSSSRRPSFQIVHRCRSSS